MQNVCPVEYYAAVKRGGLLTLAMTWANPKDTGISERVDAKAYVFCEISRMARSVGRERRFVAA